MTRRGKVSLAICILTGTVLLGSVLFLDWSSLWGKITAWYSLATDQGRIEELKNAWGPIGGPIVFIGLQIGQVVLAPIPGEASGFVGGYIFGVLPGFFYSTIGLAIGSVINFLLGRLLGRRYVEKWVPPITLQRVDALAKHQGTILFFGFFVFPGFPKDYLCIFLGLTSISAKIFLLMTAIGRMPGTLMLSLQGAQVFQKDYVTLFLLIGITVAFVVPVFLWRQRIYAWIDRSNKTQRKNGQPEVQ